MIMAVSWGRQPLPDPQNEPAIEVVTWNGVGDDSALAEALNRIP
jgi:hypothetical protein